MEMLLAGENAKSAYDYAISIHGKNDQIWYGPCEEEHIPAYPQFRGDKKALFKWEFNNSDGSEPSGQETTARKNVEVRDAYSEKMEIVGYGNAVCRVPEVIISDTDTSAVNDEIINDHSRTMDFFSENAPKYTPDYWEYEQSNTPLGLDYEYYIAEDFVSIDCYYDAFSVEGIFKEYYESRSIYNVSVKDGHILSKEEMLALLGFTEDEFDEAVRKLIKDNWDELNADFGASQGSYTDDLLMESLSDKNISGAMPYVNAKGYVCAVVDIIVGWGSGVQELPRQICKYDANLNQNSNTTTKELSSYFDTYKLFMQNELIPQYGWTDIAYKEFSGVLDDYNSTDLREIPDEDYGNSAGILSADIDDYNGDGIDDLIVVYFYIDDKLVFDNEYMEEYFSNSDSVYRIAVAAYTISKGQVVKTDEYNVYQYNASSNMNYSVGCLFSQDLTHKKFEIYKVLINNKLYLLFSNQFASSPAFRLVKKDAWMMEIDKDGKFLMDSYFVSEGIRHNYESYRYDFVNGAETSSSYSVLDAQTDPEDFYNVLDYLVDCNITYQEDEVFDYTIDENSNQVLIAGFLFHHHNDYDDQNNYYRFDFQLYYFDGGNLSFSMR